MRKIWLFVFPSLFLLASFIFSPNKGEELTNESGTVSLHQVEALSSVEIDINELLQNVICRCKDNGCYAGNLISFRPKCDIIPPPGGIIDTTRACINSAFQCAP